MTRTAEEIVDTLRSSGVPAAVVQDARDLASDPQLRSREFFVKIEDPARGSLIVDNLPMKFHDRAADRWSPAPSLGQDNRYVFMELLGFEERRFEEYVKKGIIG